ncbi:MAG: ACP S-malonyltransferase [Fusobacteriota bacterium]
MSKIAFLFPGQGSQEVGMGKDIYEEYNDIKKMYDDILENMGELKEIMFNGPEETLKETKYTQPAIVLNSLALTKLLKEKGIRPDYVAGHSLGEYSALAASGILTDKEAVLLAKERGEIMTEVASKVDGTMAAIIGLTAEKIENICVDIQGIVEAVNYNSPGQTVIAGSKEAVKKACEKLKEAGAKRAIILPVSGPFHSKLMKEAGDRLKEVFDKFQFKNPVIKLIANTDSKELSKKEEIKEELYRQTFGPVKWVDTMNKLVEAGVTEFYEIGPGRVLKGLARKIDRKIKVKNIRNIKDLEKINKS